jgi:hypothetical protein
MYQYGMFFRRLHCLGKKGRKKMRKDLDEILGHQINIRPSMPFTVPSTRGFKKKPCPSLVFKNSTYKKIRETRKLEFIHG